jgi:hypothetical protein
MCTREGGELRIIGGVLLRSKALEEFEQSIAGSIASGTRIKGSCTGERSLFQSEVGIQVDLGGLGRLVAEPESNYGSVHAAL